MQRAWWSRLVDVVGQACDRIERDEAHDASCPALRAIRPMLDDGLTARERAEAFVQVLLLDFAGRALGRTPWCAAPCEAAVTLAEPMADPALARWLRAVAGDGELDPLLAFHERFLAAANAGQRTRRGVFYTPRPIVAALVRAIDDVLRRDFGLANGLADTTSWQSLCDRHPGLVPPDGVAPAAPFVRLLDPAVGLAPFPLAVLEAVRANTPPEAWPAAAQELLPRLVGFDVLPASLALARARVLGLLAESGVVMPPSSLSFVRANSLEPPVAAVPFTVVLGNPPYSNFGAANKHPWMQALLDDYKRGLGERKINLDDDYIKFLRLAQHLLADRRVPGVVAFVTNNSFFDGLTHRRMRASLLEAFDELRFVDLHGNAAAKETAPDGSADENVFGIRQGVGLTLAIRRPQRSPGSAPRVFAEDLFGSRAAKFAALAATSLAERGRPCQPVAPKFLFRPVAPVTNARESDLAREYAGFLSLNDVFDVFAYGLQTKQDALFVDADRDRLAARMQQVLADVAALGPEVAAERHGLGTSSGWSAQRLVGRTFDERRLKRLTYRPFDWRWVYYDPPALGRARWDTMRHMLEDNEGLVVMRQVFQDIAAYTHVGTSPTLIDERTFYSNRGGTYLVPLWCYEERSSAGELSGGDPPARSANFLPLFRTLHGEWASDPRGWFAYVVAVLHASTYGTRYCRLLQADFPRIPVPRDPSLATTLRPLGERLLQLGRPETTDFSAAAVGRAPAAEPPPKRPAYDRARQRLDLPDVAFAPVAPAAWESEVGGYAVLPRLLRERTAAALDELPRLCRRLTERADVIGEIDRLIDGAGGWPGAFVDQVPRQAGVFGT